ncbi:MAG: class I SAM-dependent methyltransferase [Phycisphaerales bacterium]|nr:class I SAM-dependent methyltransferase [Phycisphaerales bacterium]
MSHAHTPACPICETESEPAFWAGGYRMYRCRGCGASFVHPVPSDAALQELYASFHLSDDEGGQYEEMENRMIADFPAKVAMVKRGMAGNAGFTDSRKIRLLDVGCGKGYFVKACRDAGIEAEGVDLSSSGVAFAREKLGVPARQGALADLKDDLGEFDVVTFWATIEHLADPVGMLRDIAEVLKPGGRLLLDTGVGDDWLDRLLPGRVQWFDPPQHLFVFSVEGMRRALAAAGFADVHIDSSYDRSALRRGMRLARNGAAAMMLRFGSTVSRLRSGTYEFRRYPIGNLMSVSAHKAARRVSAEPARVEKAAARSPLEVVVRGGMGVPAVR